MSISVAYSLIDFIKFTQSLSVIGSFGIVFILGLFASAVLEGISSAAVMKKFLHHQKKSVFRALP